MVLGGISWVHGKEAGYSSGSVYIYICGIYYLNIWFQFLCLGIMLLPKQVYCNIQRNLLRIQAWTASFSAFLCPPILLNINPVPRNTKPISPEFTDWSILEPYWSRVEGNDPPFVLEEMVFWWYQPLRSVPQILTHHDFQQFFLIDSLLYDIFIPGILLPGLPPFSQLNKKNLNDFHWATTNSHMFTLRFAKSSTMSPRKRWRFNEPSNEEAGRDGTSAGTSRMGFFRFFFCGLKSKMVGGWKEQPWLGINEWFPQVIIPTDSGIPGILYSTLRRIHEWVWLNCPQIQIFCQGWCREKHHPHVQWAHYVSIYIYIYI